MKKAITTSMVLVLLATTISFYSCKKEAATPPPNPANGVSIYKNENGRFKKEIVVTDKSGKNSVFLAISSDNESLVNNYINNYELKLIVEKKELIETMKKNAKPTASERVNIDQPLQESKQPEVENKNSIAVEVVCKNFEKWVAAYSLEVCSKNLAGAKGEGLLIDFQAGVTIVYGWDPSDFVGVVHLGISTYGLKLRFRTRSAIGIGHTYKTSIIGSGGHDYMALSSYRTGVEVTRDYREPTLITPDYYKVVWSRDQYTNNTCSYIGSWDNANCYVGTPPSGTSAFIWGTTFYYTPVPGATTPASKCPRPGSSWDGANCWAIPIPSGTNPFIYSNSWYVTGDIIPL